MFSASYVSCKRGTARICCCAAAASAVQQSIDIFYPPGPQQQTRRTPLQRANETDEFGERAFSHAGPAAWNALPDHIRTAADPVKFRKLPKSHYFS